MLNTTKQLDKIQNQANRPELKTNGRICKLGCCITQKVATKLPPPTVIDPQFVVFFKCKLLYVKP